MKYVMKCLKANKGNKGPDHFWPFWVCGRLSIDPKLLKNLGPVVQSIVSLMSSLRVISLTVLADSIYNILIFFAEKM